MVKFQRPLAILLLVVACEEVTAPSAPPFLVLRRDEGAIRQDHLVKSLHECQDLSKESDKLKVYGALGVAMDSQAETAVPALLATMSRAEGRDVELQKEIVAALGVTRSERVVPVLSRYLLKDGVRDAAGNANPPESAIKGSVVRAEAALSLMRTRSKHAVPALIEALMDSELTVRNQAISTLRYLTNRDDAYDAQNDYEDRLLHQNLWLGWYDAHKDEPRSAWIIAGFKEKGVDIAELKGEEAVSSLVKAMTQGNENLRLNATDCLADIQVEGSNSESVSRALLALLDHELESVKENALIAFVRINRLNVPVIGDDGVPRSGHCINFIPGVNLADSVAFAKNWWNNKAAQPTGSEKEPEKEPEAQ
ncbi:MAG: HEAT repeat domain-containing protein [Planctomycetota bacterium]